MAIDDFIEVHVSRDKIVGSFRLQVLRRQDDGTAEAAVPIASN